MKKIFLILSVVIFGSVPVSAQVPPSVATGMIGLVEQLQPLCVQWSKSLQKDGGTCSREVAASEQACNNECFSQDPPPANCEQTIEACKIANAKLNSCTAKVCTELLEGVPLATLAKGVSCFPPEGGKLIVNRGTGGVERIGTGANGQSKICYALLTPTGLKAFETYVAMVYKYVGWIIGVLAVLAVIISGLQMTIGAAMPDQSKNAQKRIGMIISGVVLYFLVGVILRTINPNFFT